LSTVDVVDLLVSFGDIVLWIVRLLLLISLFGHLEHLICETLLSVAVLDLVLSLRMENADPIQETFKLARPGLILLVAMRPLYVVQGVSRFPLLVMALGGAGLI
jgi:hypothetical protein